MNFEDPFFILSVTYPSNRCDGNLIPTQPPSYSDCRLSLPQSRPAQSTLYWTPFPISTTYTPFQISLSWPFIDLFLFLRWRIITVMRSNSILHLVKKDFKKKNQFRLKNSRVTTSALFIGGWRVDP